MKIRRRRLLQGFGAAAAATPFMQSIPSQAGGEAFPKRLVVFASPNNSIDSWAWTPDGASDGDMLPATLPEMLSALEGYRDNLVVLGNMVMDTRDTETGPGGHVGMGHQLTGWANNPWPDLTQESEYWGGGVSIDQYIADALGVDALTLAALPRATNGGARISYTAADEPSNPYDDPVKAFASLFGDTNADPAEQVQINARKIRSIDQTAIELERLRGKIASDDRPKLDAHLEHLLDLQNKLENMSPALCDPTSPEAVDFGSSSQFPVVARRQMDVLVEALACGVTQVATLQNGNTGGAESYSGSVNWPSEGISFDRSQHVIAHDYEENPSDDTFRTRRIELEKFYVGQYAYLLERLRSVPEGDGTLLDNTLVVWTKGMGRGHSKDRLLYLLAGGSGFSDVGFGRFLDRDGIPHNNLLVTLANLMGVETTSFGDPDICTGAVSL